jgi:hypothetical protein
MAEMIEKGDEQEDNAREDDVMVGSGAKDDDDKREVKDVGMVGGEVKDCDDERVVKNCGMIGDDEMGEMRETGDEKEDEVKDDGLMEDRGDRFTCRVGVRDDMGGRR